MTCPVSRVTCGEDQLLDKHRGRSLHSLINGTNFPRLQRPHTRQWYQHSTQCWLWWSYLLSTMWWHADKYCSNGMRNFLSSSLLVSELASHGSASRCRCHTSTQCDNMSVTLWHVTLSPIRHTPHFNWRRIWQWGGHNQCDLHTAQSGQGTLTHAAVHST